MQNFRIAQVQCRSTATGEIDANIAKMEDGLRQAAAKGVELVAFPEVNLSGYLITPEEVRGRALGRHSASVRAAVELAADYSLYVAFGFFERAREKIFNTYCLTGLGHIIGCQRKVHIPARETGLFSPGTTFNVFELPFAKIGLSICFDNEICESHLTLALKGAEVILMPAAWSDHWEREGYIEHSATDNEVIAERKRWMYMMFGARCRDTGTYSALINHAGPEAHGPWRFAGKSMTFAPTGRVLAEAGPWKEEILYAELDAEILEKYRNMDCFALKNRRPEAYRAITDQSTRE